MRVYVWPLVFACSSALTAAAQSACPSAALADAAQQVATIRKEMHAVGVRENDPNIPAALATQLAALKDALAHAAGATLACATRNSTPEQLQTELASALHANLPNGTEIPVEIKDNKELGVYGSDLGVQVFQLSGTPKFFEVDFRYGIPCGDDNVLLVYEAAPNAPHAWEERLRWDAPGYKTVGDALGDFVMLTPLTGSYEHPTWRFLVAHGHPGCGRPPRPSHFTLELLRPGADPAKPVTDWHYEHAYTQSPSAVPRLATTEDTIDFRIQPESTPARGAHAAKTPTAKPQAQIFRFRLTGNGQIEPLPANAPEETTPQPSGASSTTSSPQ